MIKMWKNWFGILLSLGVALMPFLGFPKDMKDIFYTVSGLTMLIIFFMFAGDRANTEQ